MKVFHCTLMLHRHKLNIYEYMNIYIYILCTKQICCICKAHAQRMPKDWSRHHMHSSLVALWPWRSEAMTGYSASSPDEVRAKSETKTCPGIKWEGRTGRGRDWETQTGIMSIQSIVEHCRQKMLEVQRQESRPLTVGPFDRRHCATARCILAPWLPIHLSHRRRSAVGFTFILKPS
jgi:hypothetical protein